MTIRVWETQCSLIAKPCRVAASRFPHTRRKPLTYRVFLFQEHDNGKCEKTT